MQFLRTRPQVFAPHEGLDYQGHYLSRTPVYELESEQMAKGASQGNAASPVVNVIGIVAAWALDCVLRHSVLFVVAVCCTAAVLAVLAGPL